MADAAGAADPAALAQLRAMGFPADRATHALLAADHDLQRAIGPPGVRARDGLGCWCLHALQ